MSVLGLLLIIGQGRGRQLDPPSSPLTARPNRPAEAPPFWVWEIVQSESAPHDGGYWAQRWCGDRTSLAGRTAWLAAKLVQCRQCGEQVYLMVALTCAVASLNQGRHAVHDAAIHRARQFASQIGLHWTQRRATLCPCPTRYPKTGTACAASEVVSSEVVSLVGSRFSGLRPAEAARRHPADAGNWQEPRHPGA